ncbi:MAG: DUF1987 domain-containing protein [Bacteroidales bacterium]|jgi:hypothetical protein|nr:DUF1987 domain-containing protein [Bacteroidales bacterium]MDD4385396.1 DUF1987 domain-containing protein [Bacteroidales bacterium]MDY0197169.1 DUF1987 domain-containing protein [Tenuifilaceae bacterium]
MLKIEIKETVTTPYTLLDADNGIIKVEGRSIPENVIDFYQPILNWIDNYVKEPNDRTELHFKLEYFNTSSSKRLFDIMRKVEGISLLDAKTVVINWYYEEDDEDIYFAGNDYKALITRIDFNLIEIQENF